MRTFTPYYVTDHVVVTVHCCEDVQIEEEQEGECPLCKKKYSFLIDEEGHIKVKEHRQRSKNEPNLRDLLHQSINTFYKYANNREVSPKEILHLGLFFGCISNLLKLTSDELLAIATDAERMQKWRQERKTDE